MKIAILGDGGLARELRWLLEVSGHRATLHGPDEERAAWRESWVIGVGSPPLRKAIADRCPSTESRSIGLVVDSTGHAYPKDNGGALLLAGVRVTCDVSVGAHALLNLNVTVGHDTRIGAYSVINPGANISGHVTIGECVLVGAGACIREGVTIGDGATVGMGAVVLRDVPAGEVWVGNPARRLR